MSFNLQSKFCIPNICTVLLINFIKDFNIVLHSFLSPLHFLYLINSVIFCWLLKFYLFIYFWLCWIFVSVRGPPPVAVSGGHSSSRCAGLSLSWPLLLRSTGSRRVGSVVEAHGPSCSTACGIPQTRVRTCVPCIGRQTLNHCATREALHYR